MGWPEKIFRVKVCVAVLLVSLLLVQGVAAAALRLDKRA